MNFYKDQIFHVYNQGNNRQVIFYTEENYFFFYRKMKEFICPYADFLGYCLMPNHFHFLIYVKETELLDKRNRLKSLNNSIGTMLMSYTSAINKQEKMSGSLFRNHTKAKDGWEDDVITIDSKNRIKMFLPDNEYAAICLHYIHENPVKANLVTKPEDWYFSSASEYAGLRNEVLCNVDLGKNLLGIE